MNAKDKVDEKNPRTDDSTAGDGRGKTNNEHGNNFATVTIDQIEKSIHRGSYTVEELKVALGVGPGRELDLIDKGTLRGLTPGERLAIKDGMEFVSRQPAGGAS